MLKLLYMEYVIKFLLTVFIILTESSLLGNMYQIKENLKKKNHSFSLKRTKG